VVNAPKAEGKYKVIPAGAELAVVPETVTLGVTPLLVVAVKEIVYAIDEARPVMAYGEPVVKVAVTVEPLVGTAVTVFDVVLAGFVNAIVIELEDVPDTLKDVGGGFTTNEPRDFSAVRFVMLVTPKFLCACSFVCTADVYVE
jgi:hypothetical protein